VQIAPEEEKGKNEVLPGAKSVRPASIMPASRSLWRSGMNTASEKRVKVKAVEFKLCGRVCAGLMRVVTFVPLGPTKSEMKSTPTLRSLVPR
jgi:hypothetical protein